MNRALALFCVVSAVACAVWTSQVSAGITAARDTDPNLLLGSGSGDSGEAVADNAPAPEELGDEDDDDSPDDGPPQGDSGPGGGSGNPGGGKAPGTATPPVAAPKPPPPPKLPPPPPSICRNFYTTVLPGRTRVDSSGDCWHQDPSVDVLLDERTDKLVYHVGDMVTFTEKVVDRDSSEVPDVHLQKAIPPGMEILTPYDVSWDYIDPYTGNYDPGLCHVEGGVGTQLVDCMFPLINSGQQWTVTIKVRANRPGLFRSNIAPGGTDSLSDPHRWNLAFAGTDKRADPNETVNYGLGSVLVLGLVWEGKAYRTPQQLAPWLMAHRMTWKQFRRRYPGAVRLLTGRYPK